MNEIVKKKTMKERKESLRQKMAEMIKTSSPNGIGSGRNSVVYVHVNDLKQNYEKEEFKFLPGEFMLDQNRFLSICLGAGKSPNIESPHALWFLSEESDKVNFIDTQQIKDGLKKKFIPLKC